MAERRWVVKDGVVKYNRSFPIHGGMMRPNYLTDHYQTSALTAMVVAAEGMGVQTGVAIVSVQEKRSEMRSLRFAVIGGGVMREPWIQSRENTNCFGVAMEMLAVMMGTGFRPGHYQGKLALGETYAKGGQLKVDGDYTIYVVFYGGGDDNNEQLAELGMKMMLAV